MALSRDTMPAIPADARALFRQGAWTERSSGICVGYTNANLCIVPKELAYDFLLFCQRNPKPCPALEVLDSGDPIVRQLANGADIRSDLPRYRVFIDGEVVDEPTDINKYWRDDLVTFLFGCSSTFEGALEAAGIEPRWRQGQGTGSGVFATNIETVPAGGLHGQWSFRCAPFRLTKFRAQYRSPHAFPTTMARRYKLATQRPLASTT